MSLFPDLPPISKKKTKALEQVLVSWGKLDKFIQMYNPDARYLKHLIQMEHSGRNRVAILERLVGKLGSANRRHLYTMLSIPPKK